jgi:hypothetical protein
MEVELVGQRIKNIRNSTNAERVKEGWDQNFQVIVLENGNKLYPSQDYEGNGSGALFGKTKSGKTFAL